MASGKDRDQRSTFVSVKGKQIIAPNGEPLLLKGMGIGNWLLPEGYMTATGKR
jgi:hypothetical protein